MLKKFAIETYERNEFTNITTQINKFINESKVTNGVCTIFIPHTTAAVTINENADPDVVSDILKKINSVFPQKDEYQHAEGNSDSHIKSSLFGPSLQLIINEGQLLLGTWQSVYFCEFDGPRKRNYFVKISN